MMMMESSEDPGRRPPAAAQTAQPSATVRQISRALLFKRMHCPIWHSSLLPHALNAIWSCMPCTIHSRPSVAMIAGHGFFFLPRG